MSIIKLNYPLDAAIVLDETQNDSVLSNLKKAHVQTVWLAGFFFGKMQSSIQQLKQAKKHLERHGFEVGIINVPVGHPGNALNPEEDLDLEIPSHWRYRVDQNGQDILYCADIDEAMIKDNVQVVQRLKEAGFNHIFMDDDLRLGNWGGKIQGCFCSHCINEFNEIYKHDVTREELGSLIEKGSKRQILRNWVKYNCRKVNHFMERVSLPDINIGIMVMHLGDERHGINIPDIKNNDENCMFRIGEAHFNDDSFGTPLGKASEMLGIKYHLHLSGREKAYSETTVFPPRALDPKNFLYKLKMAMTAGISNIFLMSGTWLIEDRYWHELSLQIDEIEKIEQKCSPYERVYPIHIAYGTNRIYSKLREPSPVPFLAGFPVKPVDEKITDEEGEILLVFGDHEFEADWENQFSRYQRVILDQQSAERNHEKLKNSTPDNVLFFNNRIEELPQKEGASLLRDLLLEETKHIPKMIKGMNIGLVWIKELSSVILLNLENHKNNGVLQYNGRDSEVQLEPLSFAFLNLDKPEHKILF